MNRKPYRRIVEIDGIEYTTGEAAIMLGISRRSLNHRLFKGEKEINGVKIRTVRKEKNYALCVRCLETGEVFPSVKEAARATHLNYHLILNALSSDDKKGGVYHWERA